METRQTLVADSAPTRRRRVRFRTAMLVGAGLTLGVWLFAGLFFSRRIEQIQARTSVISQRYLRAQQVLTEARNQVLLSSVYLREALLDPSDPFVADSRARMVAALDVAEENLAKYVPVLDGSLEVARVERLKGEVAALRHEMEGVLSTDRRLWPSQAGALLRGRLMPRRESVIRVADELGTLNRTAFVEHQAETAAIYRATQAQVWQVLGLAVLASVGIALLASRYGGRLERRVQEQQAKDAEMQAQLQRLSSALIRAREDERQNIARELHDEIGQLLTATKVEMAVAQRSIERGDSDEHFDEARRVMDRALHAVRDLSHFLHPAVLDDLGLVAAVEAQVRAVRKRISTQITFTHDVGTARLPVELERAGYRIVQEALSNVVKHAAATTCDIRIVVTDGRLVLDIDDDGRGFGAPRMETSMGLGLISMRERTAQLGGTIVIESGDGRGTHVHVECPVHHDSRSGGTSGSEI